MVKYGPSKSYISGKIAGNEILTPSNVSFPAFVVFVQLAGVKTKSYWHENHSNCFLNNHNYIFWLRNWYIFVLVCALNSGWIFKYNWKLAYMRWNQLSYRFRKYITILCADWEKIVKYLFETGNYPEKLVKFSWFFPNFQPLASKKLLILAFKC